MTQVIRTFKETPRNQGVSEKVGYRLTTTPWGSSPTNEAVAIYLKNRDVSATCLSGSPSVNGDVITTPLVQNLKAGKRYKLVISFDAGGNTWETWGYIDGEL